MKLIELAFNQFKYVQPLFNGSTHLEFTFDAVIAGNSPGKIWVDRIKNPQSALCWDKAHCYYLGGDPGNSQFNNGIKTLFREIMIPNALANHRDIYKIECSSAEWNPILLTIMKGTFPIKSTRYFYAYKKNRVPERRDILPTEFQVQKIDKELLDSKIKNVEAIIDEIKECWNSIEGFLNNGFGFCLIRKPKSEELSVQGWCTGEYFSEAKCGIGIETFGEFRGRGFATAMASAFVEHSCLANIQPHWDVMAKNQASIRVAEKVGFERIQEYTVLFGSFTDVDK